MEAYIHPLLGGIILAFATQMLLFFNGRICGISGILGGALETAFKDLWRVTFLIGLLLGGYLFSFMRPDFFQYDIPLSVPVAVVGGLLVGIGTRMGGGCTSGHGVCGMARFSKRSILATILFIASGVVTVFLKKLF